MRVLHVTDGFLPRVGGIEYHVRDLASRQRVAGHEAYVATRTPGPANDTVLRVEPGRWDWLATVRPDVLHAHLSVASPFGVGAARRAVAAGVPTVITVHSMWNGYAGAPWLVAGLTGMNRWPVVWTAVSEAAARPVHQAVGAPVRVLPNAVDLEAWSPTSRVAPGPPVVLSVMRLTRTKRAMPLARILRAAAAQTDLRATIVGDGPEGGAVAAYLRRHRLEDRVRLTGTLDRAEVRTELARAAVFLAPAHRESFGIAALEARASGIPVVASSRSGVPSFVEHGVEGLLAADDEGLADQLVRLVADDGLRARIAAHNRRVATPYDWAHAQAAVQDAYDAALTAAHRALQRLAGGIG